MKSLLIRVLSDKVHKDFKIHCVQIGLSQQEVINRLIVLETKDSLALGCESAMVTIKDIDTT